MMDKRKCRCAFVLSFVVGMLFSCNATQSGIRVEGNGYVGVTVAISGRIMEDSSLIENIKRAFREGSKLLYSSTRRKLYFKNIDIIIPKEWAPKKEYISIYGYPFETSPIRVDEKNPSKGITPYVLGLSGCGGRGRYMHLTPELLSSFNSSRYGPLDHVIVHEWGHLRFGVYDEYPTVPDPSNSNFKQHFYSDGGTWKPVRCTEEIKGVWSRSCTDKTQSCKTGTNGKPEITCRFCPDSATTNTRASLMGSQWLSSLTDFCDSDLPSTASPHRHNSKAVNNQNQFCYGKSVWEVLKDHSDFQGLSSGTSQQNIEPVFGLFQEQSEAILVLVLDISGSMHGGRLRYMREAAKFFLMNTVTDGTWVGIVLFSSSAFVSHSLTQVTSAASRQNLTNALPTTAEGSTSIGAGLQEGYQMIIGHTNASQGATLFLVTDGRENKAPFIKDVQPSILDKGIKVTTLAYGQNADSSLESLASASGGQSFFYAGESNSSGLVEAFQSLVPPSDSPVQIISEYVKVSVNRTLKRNFKIDKTLGGGIYIYLRNEIFSYTNVSIEIQTPQGIVYSANQSLLDESPTLNINETFEAGQYLLQIVTDSKTGVAGTLSISSKKRTSSDSTNYIDIKGWLSETDFRIPQMQRLTIYVSVQKGYAPVVHAEVIAYVEDSYRGLFQIPLLDNGIGSDTEERDGIYSSNIISSQLMKEGRHSVKVIVKSVEGKSKILLQDEILSDGYLLVLKEESVEDFQREAVIDQFTVNGTINNITDIFPPARIATLNIEKYSFENQTFTLTWKATGDDFEFGRALSYDIRMLDDSEMLRKHPESGIQLTMPTPPKQAGETETLEIRPNSTTENETLYIGVRAIDDNNNYGDMSNIISISVITDPQWFPSTDDASEGSFPTTYVILIGALLIVLLLSVLVIICMRLVCKKRKSPKSTVREGFDSPREQFHDPREHFNDTRDHFNVPRIHLNNPRDPFHNPRKHFNNPRAHFHNPREHFNNPLEHFHNPREHFNDTRDHFNNPREHFHNPREHFNNPREYFHNTREHCSNIREDFNNPREHFHNPRKYFHNPAYTP